VNEGNFKFGCKLEVIAVAFCLLHSTIGFLMLFLVYFPPKKHYFFSFHFHYAFKLKAKLMAVDTEYHTISLWVKWYSLRTIWH
jgi:hypothetical protein